MEILDFLNLLAGEASRVCSPRNGLGPIFGIIGWVLLIIKIAVPIILIVMGMIDMTKAIMSKKDDEIKTAQTTLIKKAIAAVTVFLIVTLVTLIFTTIMKQTDYKACKNCINHPTSCKLTADF